MSLETVRAQNWWPVDFIQFFQIKTGFLKKSRIQENESWFWILAKIDQNDDENQKIKLRAASHSSEKGLRRCFKVDKQFYILKEEEQWAGGADQIGHELNDSTALEGKKYFWPIVTLIYLINIKILHHNWENLLNNILLIKGHLHNKISFSDHF